MKTSIQFITTIVTISFLSACGGGGSSDDGDVKTGQFDDVKTGQFKDSVVEGLTYKTATQSGTTDEKGTFKYKAGEEVVFKIGAMEIGRAKGADILYPTHITDDKEKAIKVAQVLQTLDKDGNPEEGINIKGQFKVESTKNHNIQDIDLQVLVDDIKKTADSLRLVSNDEAEKHMQKQMSVDKMFVSRLDFADSTLESISNQDNMSSRVGVDDGRLKLSPQNADNVWLLAKNDTEITSLSAEVEFVSEAETRGLGLLIELNDGSGFGGIKRFRIAITHIVGFCGTGALSCLGFYTDFITIRHQGSFAYTDGTLAGSIDLYESVQRSESSKYIPPSEIFKANFTIEFDRVAKKVIIKYGDKQGYFGVGSLFDDFSKVQAKFFIETQGWHATEKSVFVDNVKINNQDFDDFSAPTLDATKWKTGKFYFFGGY